MNRRDVVYDNIENDIVDFKIDIVVFIEPTKKRKEKKKGKI